MSEIRCTYRLQFNAQFTFDDAAAIAGYLAALGVSHVYCSPYFAAAPGSMHGYDIIDFSRVNPELGGEAGWRRFVDALSAHGLGQIVDMVPNHMSIVTEQNQWWADVLAHGASSRFAPYFDVDWHPADWRFQDAILLPVLADHYGLVLERGQLQLARDGTSFWIVYEQHRFPVSPHSLGPILARAARLAGEDEATAAAIDRVIAATNRDVDALDEVIQAQHYRLARWRVAARELGYRRFFDINSLIALRTEDDAVFRDTHDRLFGWIRDGAIDGVRVDHIDGLRDPEQYLRRLRDAAPDTWLVVEKILQRDERLPASWPVAGTTGYDFLGRVTELYVDVAGLADLSQAYAGFTSATVDFDEAARAAKHLVLRDVLGADVNRLTQLLVEICERHRRYRDYSRHELAEGVREVLAALPVYRTYGRRPSAHTAIAADRAAAARPDLEPELFTFLTRLLAGDFDGALADEFAARFQQLSGPAMAKGVEDTAFYTFNRLLALNDVGCDPSGTELDVAAFHKWLADAAAQRPASMLATTTHDSKRSEDVRARLCVLSQRAGDWRAALTRWSAMLDRYRTGDWPDRNLEYYILQTLIGAWPIDEARLQTHVEKAIREAKTWTSWTAANPDYEAAVRTYVTGACTDAPFQSDLAAFVAPMIVPARMTSLSMTLLKLTAPGVPDLYQGTELWSLRLVDPDNRGAVDFAARQSALTSLSPAPPAHAIADPADIGLPKLWLIQRALALRRRHHDVFASGAYTPIAADGPRADRVIAFTRGADVVVAVPRLTWNLGVDDWRGTTLSLPEGDWRDALGNRHVHAGGIDMSELWRDFPVALLERVPPGQ